MMRPLLLIAFLGLATLAKADQLAYITKDQAEAAAKYLNKGKKVYLFCGCCSPIEPVKVKIKSAQAVHTGYEDYWEVKITYINENGEEITEGIDLAYVWKKGLIQAKTLGTKFKMDHDSCIPLKEWDDPKHVEKDI